jgi:hypothetical protein
VGADLAGDAGRLAAGGCLRGGTGFSWVTRAALWGWLWEVVGERIFAASAADLAGPMRCLLAGRAGEAVTFSFSLEMWSLGETSQRDAFHK